MESLDQMMNNHGITNGVQLIQAEQRVHIEKARVIEEEEVLQGSRVQYFSPFEHVTD